MFPTRDVICSGVIILPPLFILFFLMRTQIVIPPPSTDGVIPLYKHIGLVNVNFGLGK